MTGKNAKKTLSALVLAGLMMLAGCGGQSDDVDSLKKAGELALESGDFNKAINIFKDALTKKPSDRDLLYNLAISFKRFDMPDSALTYFKRARILYPRDRAVNMELIELCPVFGDYEGAINAIAMLVVTGDNEKIYWARLAEFYYQNKDLPMAARYYKLILDDNPENRTYYLYLSNTLSQLGRLTESNEVMNRSIERFGPSAEAYANIAVNYINLKMLDKAEEYFQKSLAVNPENIPVWINLANVLSEQGGRSKKEEALEIYKRFESQTPEVYRLDSLIPALEAELGQ